LLPYAGTAPTRLNPSQNTRDVEVISIDSKSVKDREPETQCMSFCEDEGYQGLGSKNVFTAKVRSRPLPSTHQSSSDVHHVYVHGINHHQHATSPGLKRMQKHGLSTGSNYGVVDRCFASIIWLSRLCQKLGLAIRPRDGDRAFNNLRPMAHITALTCWNIGSNTPCRDLFRPCRGTGIINSRDRQVSASCALAGIRSPPVLEVANSSPLAPRRIDHGLNQSTIS
jgi:hypothetical protein